LLVFALIDSTLANSEGTPSICDAYDEELWKPEQQGGHIMYWATAPTHSPRSSVRTADGPISQDPKTYTPGKLTYIHVRSLVQGEKYRGLMMYAKDKKGNKVGSWELPVEDEPRFHLPDSCGGKTVLHAGADEKSYLNVFPFRGPPKGTGMIKFEVLLKYGEANTGYFSWPNKKDLSLTESQHPETQSWFKGAVGESCKDTCQKNGFSMCGSQAVFKSANNADSLQAAVASNYVCRQPMLSSCGASPDGLPGESSESKYCYYRDCPQGTSYCGVSTPGIARFCPCNRPTSPKASQQLLETSEDVWDESRGSWVEEAISVDSKGETPKSVDAGWTLVEDDIGDNHRY